MYTSVPELLTWQRVVRREAGDLYARFTTQSTRVPLVKVPIDGAELLCPACSSEARPDDGDTATCGSCGTLSPLDATAAFSNFVHQSLHSGIRVRSAMFAGLGGAEIPSVAEPFPRLLARVGSLLVMGAVAGLRKSELDKLLTDQKPLIQRWIQKESEEGNRALAESIPTQGTGGDVVQAVLQATMGDLPADFPGDGTVPFALEQVFYGASQYYKFRTTSTYVVFLAAHLTDELRSGLGLEPLAPVPWKDASVLAKMLHADARGEHILDHHRGSEEALAKALTQHLTEELRLVRGVLSRHRVAAEIRA